MHQGWFKIRLFVSGSLVWSKPKLLRVTVWEISPNVVHILVMFDSHDPCLDDNDDIIDDANTRPQEALRILQFPFDDSRCDTLFSTPPHCDVPGTQVQLDGIWNIRFSFCWGPFLCLSYQLGCMERILRKTYRWPIGFVPSFRGCCAAGTIAKSLSQATVRHGTSTR